MKYCVIYYEPSAKKWIVWWNNRDINDAHLLKENLKSNNDKSLVWLVVEANTDLSKLFNPLIK